MQKNLTAVVTVRKNSVRVPNKNLKTFCGKNILVHKIEVLKKIKGLDGIIINTDSDEAIAIAQKYDVSHFRREDYFASSECTNSEFWANIAQNTKSKYIMFTHCIWISPWFCSCTRTSVNDFCIFKVFKQSLTSNTVLFPVFSRIV